jgi:hypothetical protein
MKLDEATWQEVIAAAQAGIDKWNASAKEKSLSDKFTLRTTSGEKFTYIITEHTVGQRVSERRMVARELATGELRKATPVKVKKGSGTQIKITNGPKSWDKLAGKSPERIAGLLKLTDFLMLISGSGAKPSSSTVDRVSGFLRSDHSKNVDILLLSGSGDPFSAATKIAGPEYCFHAATTMSVDAPRDAIGVLMTTDELYERVPELNPFHRQRKRA